MKKLKPELEAFAKSIGATHINLLASYANSGSDFYRKDGHAYKYGKWHSGWPSLAILDTKPEFVKIDYSGADKFSSMDFQLAVEQLVEYCHNLSIMCGELDIVEQMLKEM